jgi:hypothetical protein
VGRYPDRDHVQMARDRLPGELIDTDGTALPGLISLSYARGATVANAAIVAAGRDGAIRLYNNGAAPVTITVDLTGSYYAY